MNKLSNEVKNLVHRKKNIVDIMLKDGYNEYNIAVLCAMCIIPIYVAYYFIYEETKNEDALKNCKRLCEEYRLEFDL
jgi:hypothetical protein